MKKLEKKFIIVILTVSLIPLLLFSSYYLNHSKNQIKSQIQNQILSTLKIKQQALDRHLKMINHNGAALSQTKVFKDFLNDTLNQHTAPKESDFYSNANELLLNYQEHHWGLFHHIFIADKNGQIILSPGHNNSTKSHFGEDASHSKFFKPGLENPVFTDFFGFEETDHYHQLHIHPIKSASGTPLGAIVFEICIDYVYELLYDQFQIGETGTISLYSLEGVPVVNKKADLVKSIDNPGLKDALKQNEEVFIKQYKNHHNEKVQGIFYRDMKYPWILAVEVHQDEIYAPIYQLIKQSLFILIGFIILLSIIGLFIGQKLSKPIIHIAQTAQKIADGDLNQRVDIKSHDEIGDLGNTFNQMIDNLKAIITQLQQASMQTSDSASNLAQNSKNINVLINQLSTQSNGVSNATSDMTHNFSNTADSIQNVSATIGSIAAAIEEMNATINEIASQCSKESQITTAAYEKFQQSKSIMEALQKSASQIGAVITTISDIAKQTKILALNASIEAASAGEAGKSFAVVANEVKELADQTESSTSEIEDQITQIQETAEKAVQAMHEVTETISSINEISQSIACSIEEQSATSNEISSNINGASHSTKETSNSVIDSSQKAQSISETIEQFRQSIEKASDESKQVSSESTQLSELAELLKDIAGKFKI